MTFPAAQFRTTTVPPVMCGAWLAALLCVLGAAAHAQPLAYHAVVEAVDPPLVQVRLTQAHAPAQWEGDYMAVNPVNGEDLKPEVEPRTGTVSVEDETFMFVENKRLRILTTDGKARFHDTRKSFGYLTGGRQAFVPMGTPLTIFEAVQMDAGEVGVVAAQALVLRREGSMLTALLREDTRARPVQPGQRVQLGPMDVAYRIELQAQVRGQQVAVPVTLYGQDIGTTDPLVLWLAPNTYEFKIEADAYYPITQPLVVNPTLARGEYSRMLDAQPSQLVIVSLTPRRPAPELLQAGENSVRRGANGEAIPLLREALATDVDPLEGTVRAQAERLLLIAEEGYELQQYAEQQGATPEQLSAIARRRRSLQRNLEQENKLGVRTVLDELLQDIPASHPLMQKYEAVYQQL